MRGHNMIEDRTKSGVVLQFQPLRAEDARLSSVIDLFLREWATGCADTLHAKARDLNQCWRWLNGKLGRAPLLKDLTPRAVQDFLAYREACGKKPATVRRQADHLKNFIHIVSEEIPGFSNFSRRIHSPRAPKKMLIGLSLAQWVCIRKVICADPRQGEEHKHYRRYFLFELLINTGLRVDEALGLIAEQLDLEYRVMRDVQRKQQKISDIYINHHVRDAAGLYLPHRETYLEQHDPRFARATDIKRLHWPLFASAWGRLDDAPPEDYRLSNEQLRKDWKATCKAAGITDKRLLHPHVTRHTLCRWLLEKAEGADGVKRVAEIMDISLQHLLRYAESTAAQREELLESLD